LGSGLGSERLKALKVSLGDMVPEALASELLSRYSPSVVSDVAFISHLTWLLMVFDGYRLSTSLLNPETVSFIVLLYARPPEVAFIYLDIDGSYKVNVLTPKGRYRFIRDGLTPVLGLRHTFTPEALGSTVPGDYVPVSGKYLVIGELLSDHKPRFRVVGRRSWYVYEVGSNPVPVNISFLLSLLP